MEEWRDKFYNMPPSPLSEKKQQSFCFATHKHFVFLLSITLLNNFTLRHSVCVWDVIGSLYYPLTSWVRLSSNTLRADVINGRPFLLLIDMRSPMSGLCASDSVSEIIDDMCGGARRLCFQFVISVSGSFSLYNRWRLFHINVQSRDAPCHRTRLAWWAWLHVFDYREQNQRFK